MSEFFQEALAGLQAQTWPETLAVSLALAYLILAMRQSLWCWPCAFVSTALFTWLFFDVNLLMEAALNVYYLGMAVYGYWSWQKGQQGDVDALPIRTWPLRYHGIALLGILLATALSGTMLTRYTEAAWPYLDSFTTWGSVVTTYMVARKVFENWLYWLVIDSIALFLYLDRELYSTALLMMLYLVLVVLGIISWGRQLRVQHA